MNSISLGYSYGASLPRTWRCSSSINLRRHVAAGEHDIGLDDGAALGIGLGHHRGICHGRMLDQAILDLAGPDAVACGLEHVVAAAVIPEAAVGVHHRHVAGAAPAVFRAASELGKCRLFVLPVAEKEHRVALAVHVEPVQRHVTGHAARAFLATVVEHRHTVPWVRPAHAAGARWPTRLAFPAGIDIRAAIADDVVDLGLAEHFVHGHAELVAAIGKHSVAHGLASTHDGAQPQAVVPARLRHLLHHGLERGRKEKAVGHTVALHQLESLPRREAALVAHDGLAEIECGQQRVHQAAGPGPIGG